MKNRITQIFTFLFLTVAVYGSPIKIKGIIKDSENGKPVSYANVAIVEIEKGTTSDYNGTFEFEIDSTDLNSTLNISCLNYKEHRIEISKLSTENTNEILLKSFSYKIPEIVVSTEKKKQKELVLNKLKKSEISGRLSCNNLPKIYARYFPHEALYDEFNNLSSINIDFKSDQKVGNSKVRIRIMNKNSENSLPGTDILKDDLIVVVKPGINKIDIAKYNIKMPKHGIFIAVEWLIIDENSFKWVSYNQLKIKKTEILYGPILGAHYHQESYTWMYWAGKWEKYEIKVPMVHPKIKAGSYFDSAISLTLMN